MQLRNRRRLGGQDRGNQTCTALGAEGWLARDHLVQQFAKSKDVGAGIGLFSFQLLGGHVLEGSDDGAFAGELGLFHRHLGESSGQGRRTYLLGQTEIHEFGAIFREHDVGGLQITMRNTQFVRLGESVGNLCGVAQRLFQRQWTFEQPLSERLAF